ncbi:MAG: glycosyltransferase family 39 protein [Acidobacteria bacterium]|nr:glycosyltransferase family 39 protein [Acidobacteriota bacterium]
MISSRSLAPLVALALVCSLRLMSLGRDLWEWDEILFVDAVQHGIDVRVNRPHPPGYPAFVSLSQLATRSGMSPFEASRSAGVAGGILSVIGVYCLALTLGTSRAGSLFAAVAYALLPAVWLHGVRPLSDPPGAAAFLFSMTCFLRSMKGGRVTDLALGFALLAVGCGLRPQTAILLVPLASMSLLEAVRRRGPRSLVAPIFIFAVLSFLLYWPVLQGSGGLHGYIQAITSQGRFLLAEDSPGLGVLSPRVWKRWLFDPFGSGLVALGYWGASILAFFRSPRELRFPLLAAFGPTAVLSVLFLGSHVAPRYAIGLLAAPCILTGMALDGVTPRPSRQWWAATAATWLLAASASISVPGVMEVHDKSSPSVALVEALEADPRFAGRPVVVDEPLELHASRSALRTRLTVIHEWVPLAPERDALLAFADYRPIGLQPARVFAFNAAGLARFSRGRYIETSIYDGREGAAIHIPEVTGPGAWNERGQIARLRSGSTFTLRSPEGRAQIAFKVEAERRASVSLATPTESRTLEFAPGSVPMEFTASPDPATSISLRMSVLTGQVSLTQWRITHSRTGVTAGK